VLIGLQVVVPKSGALKTAVEKVNVQRTEGQRD
jgi:hypothetical protein